MKINTKGHAASLLTFFTAALDLEGASAPNPNCPHWDLGDGGVPSWQSGVRQSLLVAGPGSKMPPPYSASGLENRVCLKR